MSYYESYILPSSEYHINMNNRKWEQSRSTWNEDIHEKKKVRKVTLKAGEMTKGGRCDPIKEDRARQRGDI